MKSYSKVVYKDFKKLYKKLMAIVLIVAIGVAFLVGLLTTAPNMRYTVDKFYKDTHTADIMIQKYAPFTEEELYILKSDSLFENTMAYFTVDEQIVYDDIAHMSRIVLLDFKNGFSINQLKLIDGRLPNPYADVVEVVVEQSQAYLLDIPIGFKTIVQNQTFEVVGIVNHPWYFAYVQEISPLSGRPIESMIYVDESFLADIQYTHFAATLKDAKDLNAFSGGYKDFVEKKVETLNEKYPDMIVTTRFENQSFVKFGSDVEIVEVIALIFPIFFFLITILVSLSSMTRIIADERIQIGTLRSLGYSKFKIAAKYILYSLLASGVGVLLGIALGIYIIPLIAYNAYVVTYKLPPLRIDYHFTYISIISLTMILSVVIVTFLSIMNVLKEAPSHLLKHKAPRAGKQIFLERIPLIWNRLKFKYKSTFRNIFRQKRNLVLMLVGVAGSTALLLAGFGIKDAVDISGDAQFNQMYQFNLELSVHSGSTNIDEISTYEHLNYMTEISFYSEKHYIGVVIPEVDEKLNDYLDFSSLDDTSLTFESGNVFVSNQFAKAHGINKGDQISLEIRGVSITLEVTEVIAYYFGNQIFISRSLIEDEIPITLNKIYIKTPELSDTQINELISELDDHDDITHLQTKDDLMDAFKQTSSSMNSVIILLVIFASILAVIINYNLTLINISTRHKEMATLKVLGYQEVEVSGYIFRETFIISSVAILLGLGLGKILHYFIISQVNVDGIILKNTIDPLSYIYTVVLSYVFLVLVYVASIPKIRNIDMLEALKSFE